jgi:hypothetical protein
MLKRAQFSIGLDFAGGQVHDCLVEVVLP